MESPITNGKYYYRDFVTHCNEDCVCCSDGDEEHSVVIEGWLNVCERPLTQFPRAAGEPTEEHVWHAGFVVLRKDEGSLICYTSEQASRRGRCPFETRHRIGPCCPPPSPRVVKPAPDPVAPSPRLLSKMGHFLTMDNLHSGPLDGYWSLRRPRKAWISDRDATYDLIRDNHPPTTYQPRNGHPGTESLDRRRLQQKHSNPMAPIEHRSGPSPIDSSANGSSTGLANFLARQLLWRGLKRTKSVSKLDRHRRSQTSSQVSELLSNHSDGSYAPGQNHLPSQKSCYRLQQPPDPEPTDWQYRVRQSKSHESLLCHSTNATTHMLDVAPCPSTSHRAQQPHSDVQALHLSMTDTPNTFQLSSGGVATKTYACRTANERDAWIECLRQTMHPERQNCRRTENVVQIWILEAKGIPIKRKYFCELCFDKTLYGRTSAKLKNDSNDPFWGELFEFNCLPPIDVVSVNLYKEPASSTGERRRKKDRPVLVGQVSIPVSDLVSRQPVERWYPVSVSDRLGQKGDIASIRIKARYQSLRILPVKCYGEFLTFVENHYLPLCLGLDTATSVSTKSKEDLASSMIHVLHHRNLAREFLCDLVMQEVKRIDNDHLMFRGNSIATKAMEAYIKLVGGQYLQDTLGDFVRALATAPDDCEVDPVRVSNLGRLEENKKMLIFQVAQAWDKIQLSVLNFPLELRLLFAAVRHRLKLAGREDLADNLISSSIFLRYLCPAILSPSLFGLMSEYPNERVSRSLTLVAKTIQTLANFSQFGGKEQYMQFMNRFVHREWNAMRQFLHKISEMPSKDEHLVDSSMNFMNLGREASLLHTYLLEAFSSLPPQAQTDLAGLRDIMLRIAEEVESPVAWSSNGNIGQADSAQGSEDSSDGTTGNSSPSSPMSDYDNHSSGTATESAHLTTSTSGTTTLMEAASPVASQHDDDDGEYGVCDEARRLVNGVGRSAVAARRAGSQKQSDAREVAGKQVRRQLTVPCNSWVKSQPSWEETGKAENKSGLQRLANSVFHSPGSRSHDDQQELLQDDTTMNGAAKQALRNKGSQMSIASSSGYHSLPLSTSSNSPVDSALAPVTRTDSSEDSASPPSSQVNEAQRVTSVYNPMYSVHRTPMIPPETLGSTPQRPVPEFYVPPPPGPASPHSSANDCPCCSSSDDTVELRTPGRIDSTNRASMPSNAFDADLLSLVPPSSARSERCLLQHVQSSPVNPRSAPRTNPRYFASANSTPSHHLQQSMRRTITDSALASATVTPGLKVCTVKVPAEPERVPEEDPNLYFTELDMLKRQLNETKEKLLEAESSKNFWRTKFEQTSREHLPQVVAGPDSISLLRSTDI